MRAGGRPGAGFRSVPRSRGALRIIGELQDLCAARAVDVVFLGPETDPVLRFEVFRSGRAVHAAESDLFATEAVRALALYEDALPFRRLLQQQLTRKATP